MSISVQDVEHVDCCAHVRYRGDANTRVRCCWSTAFAQEQSPEHWYVEHPNEIANRFIASALAVTSIMTLPSIVSVVSQYHIIRHWFWAKDTSIYQELVIIDALKYTVLHTITVGIIICLFMLEIQRLLHTEELSSTTRQLYDYVMDALAILFVTHCINCCFMIGVFAYWRVLYLPRISSLSTLVIMETNQQNSSNASVVVGIPVTDVVMFDQAQSRHHTNHHVVRDRQNAANMSTAVHTRSVYTDQPLAPVAHVAQGPQHEMIDNLYCPLGMRVQRIISTVSTISTAHQRV